jgi:hypothetical protein
MTAQALVRASYREPLRTYAPRRIRCEWVVADAHAFSRLAHQALQERDIASLVLVHIIAAFGMGTAGGAKA